MITPDNMGEYVRQLQRFNVGEDCPVFDGLFEYCQIYTSGSIGGAVRLNENLSDIVINWAGGTYSFSVSPTINSLLIHSLFRSSSC